MVQISVWVEMSERDNTVKLFAEKITGMGVVFPSGAGGEVVLRHAANSKPVSSGDGLLKTRCTVQ